MLIDRFYARGQIEALLFHAQDANGRPVYFPKGKLGHGYVVATDEQKERIIQQFILSTDLVVVAIVASAFVIQFLGWNPLVIIVISIGIVVVQNMAAQRCARGLTPSEARLSRGSALRAVAKSTSWRILIFVAVGMAWMLVRQALSFTHDPSLVQLISIALLGLGAFFVTLQAYVKWRERD
jgi:hypothetical protein